MKININPQFNVNQEQTIDQQKSKLKKACADFESFLVKTIFETADSANKGNPLFGENNAEKIYKDMYHSEMSKVISTKQGLGLGQILYEKLEKVLQTPDGKEKGPFYQPTPFFPIDQNIFSRAAAQEFNDHPNADASLAAASFLVSKYSQNNGYPAPDYLNENFEKISGVELTL